MNCDQVFDILTRGPFPTGAASDHKVEAHLADCADCLRLAEALRPALELFEEAIPLDEGRDLPGYWGAARAVRGPGGRERLTQVASRPPTRRRLVPSVPRTHLQRVLAQPAWRLATAVLVGVVLAVVLRVAGLSEHSAPLQTAEAPPSGRVGVVQQASVLTPGQRRLAAIAYAPACLGGGSNTTGEPVKLASAAELDQLQCCTNCHHEGSHQTPARAVRTIAHSCVGCHQ